MKHAILKFNGGHGALLCNRCRTVIAEGFDHEDRWHLCEDCNKARRDVYGTDGRAAKARDGRKRVTPQALRGPRVVGPGEEEWDI